MKQISEDEKKLCSNVIQIEDREGYYTEAPSMLDKYERRDISINPHLRHLTYTQFCMKYASTKAKPKKDDDFRSKKVIKENEVTDLDNEEMDLIVTHNFATITEHYILPTFIKLDPLRPGEPEFMKKHKRRVIRIHKINSVKHPHEYRYAQLQKYYPFIKEEEFDAENFDVCDSIFNEKSKHNEVRKIQNVKSFLMPHLESVELGTERALEIVNSDVGDALDPTLEQDNFDCTEIGPADHPDFIFKDPTDVRDDQLSRSAFKQIDLYDDDTLLSMCRSLDDDQKIVLKIGVNYAKNIVKSKKAKTSFATQELVVVQGGAGSGKSTVIDILSQQIERILMSPGDNPESPYCIKAAFTGTAAANIKGQTLHSAFSFSFGNDFFSLGDKKRDEKRDQLSNLQAVIIDEFSFIKADMLYLLDLRLREVKQEPNKLFGGVSVFLFGDILQLRPVKAKYVYI